MRRRVVALSPPAAARSYERLWGALEDAYPVRFDRREPDSYDGADAAVLLRAGANPNPPCPSIAFSGSVASRADRPAPVALADAEPLDRRLRGRTLHEASAGVGTVAAQPQDEVLASVRGEPVWIHRAGSLEVVACSPDELAPDEPLKQHLRAGRFLGLLPLVHFLRRLVAADDWRPPPLRALLMFDDPNLHWPSYGYIDYAQLVRHAREHAYHAAMGMIPLDGALVHPRAAELFRASPPVLSLLMHGLNHEFRELIRPLPEAQREAAVARALRQVEAFERRSGVPVSRVLCAPHGDVSEPFLSTMLRLGLEAALTDLPFPWRAGRPIEGPSLTYWEGVNWVAGGFPLLPRYLFTDDREEVVFRAYLDQPLVLYGHHEDVADGLDPLAETADLVNGLGKVAWTSAERIARGNFLTRQDGDGLHVRLLARKIELDVPPATTGLEIHVPALPGGEDDFELVAGGIATRVRVSDTQASSATVPVASGPLRVELRPRGRLNPRAIRPARTRAWPVVRRALTEGRDRLRPLVA